MSENWQTYPIRKLAANAPQSFTDGDWVEAPHIRETGIRLIQTGNIGIGTFINRSQKYISQASFDTLHCKEIRPGDLLICRLAEPIGRACFAPELGERMITSVDVTILRVDTESFDPRFVSICINTPEYLRQCEAVSGGSTRQRISRTNLGKIEIKAPNIDAQRRIAQIILTLDKAIEKTEALIAKYQQIKAGLMHDLFTRGITADGKLRLPCEQAPELYQETPIGWIPMEWDVQRIGNIFDIQLGKMLNKLAKTGKWMAPYLGNRAVQWDFVDCSAIEEMNFSPSEREKFSLTHGDLLVCEGGDVGRTAMWRSELEDCYFQKAIHRLRPKSDRVLPAFMLRFMRFAKEVGYFREFTSQSSIAHLTQEKLEAIPMLLPKPNEQKWIAERFDAIDKLIQGEQSNLYKLRQQKLGLMHDLLSGAIRVAL